MLKGKNCPFLFIESWKIIFMRRAILLPKPLRSSYTLYRNFPEHFLLLIYKNFKTLNINNYNLSIILLSYIIPNNVPLLPHSSHLFRSELQRYETDPKIQQQQVPQLPFCFPNNNKERDIQQMYEQDPNRPRPMTTGNKQINPMCFYAKF